MLRNAKDAASAADVMQAEYFRGFLDQQRYELTDQLASLTRRLTACMTRGEMTAISHVRRAIPIQLSQSASDAPSLQTQPQSPNTAVPKPRRLPPMKTTELRQPRSCAIWRHCVRGDVYRLRSPRGTRGHEQRGARYAVVVQSDDLPLSTWLVAPTSTSARPASFRPEVEVEVDGRLTRVLAEQTAAVDPSRLGDGASRLTFDEMRRVDAALRIVLGL